MKLYELYSPSSTSLTECISQILSEDIIDVLKSYKHTTDQTDTPIVIAMVSWYLQVYKEKGTHSKLLVGGDVSDRDATDQLNKMIKPHLPKIAYDIKQIKSMLNTDEFYDKIDHLIVGLTKL